MNIKKLFSVAAVVTFLGSTFLPGLALAATPDTELGKAYEWAYANGITTKDTYEAANMTAPITRAEMAKMLSNYAKKFQEKTPDTSATCNFNDTASVGGDLAVAIVESCQLGIMGQGINAFRPYDTITRAEFGTALSRVLWDKTYEGGTPYYAGHLNALKAAGIMTVIANAESMKEVRGYVMLMLMRSENETPSICEETDVKVICAVEEAAEEYKDCPAACRKDNTKEEEKDSDEVVKAGDLDVTVSGNSNGNLFIGRDSELDTITLKTSEEVSISRIVLERIGYSTKDNIVNVKLEDSKGATIADAKTLDSKGQVKLTLKKDYKVVDGELDAIIVVNTLNDGTTKAIQPGATVGFKVVDVESTAKNLNISGKANTYSAIKFDGSKLTFTIRKNAEKEYNWTAGESYEVAKFKVAAPDDSSIVLRGFTFSKNNSTLDLRKYFDSAEVTIAGEKVSGLEASVNKDDELVVTFKDYEVAAKEKAEVVVKIALVEDFDQFNGSNEVELALKDFVAVDGKVDSRVSTTNNPAANDPYYGGFTHYKFKGGKVKLTNVKLWNVDAAEDSEDTVVAEGTITVPEAIKGTFKIEATGAWIAALKQMTVVVNGEETDADPEWTPANCTYATPCTKATFTFKNVEIEKSGKVKFLVDIKQFRNDDADAERNALNNKTINFTSFSIDSFANTLTAVVYDESNKSARDEISGSISFSKVTIQPAKASLTNSTTKDVEFANKETNKKPVFEGTYTAKKGDVKLNEFVIESKATTMTDLEKLIKNWTVEYNKVRFYVTIGNDEVSDAKITCTPAGAATACTAWDTFDNILVKAGESVKVLVEAEVEANDVLNAAWTAFDTTTYNSNSYVNATSINLGKYEITLKWEDVNGNKAGEGKANTAALKVVIKGSVTLGTDNSKNTVLKKAADALIASFTVKPANGASETDLESISFNVAWASMLTNENDITVKLNNVVVDDCTVANGTPDTVTCTMTEKIGSEWVTVDVLLVNEESGTVTVDTLVINGKSQSRSYTRKFVDSYVKINSQRDLGGKTQFTLDVDEDSDYAVSDLVIFFDNTIAALGVDKLTAGTEKACKDSASTAVSCFDATAVDTEEVLSHNGDATWVAYIKWAFGDGETVEVKGLSNNSRDVTAIAYKAWAAWVIIQKSSFNDFFKVSDGTYARAFQTSK